MNRTKNKYPSLTIRLNENERQEIENRADRASLSMGGYCKWVIFNTPPPRRSRVPSVDKTELSRLIGQVGALGNNVNQISRQIHRTSAFNIESLDKAVRDISDIRSAIMRALGYREDDH